jgi:methionyl-tRNA synthetase
MDRTQFYVTTPIYYVNDKPHIGHAYTTILADVLARYHRMLGVPTYFLTGTDEHGQKVEKAAKAAGMTPQQQADTTVVRFQELWEYLDITNDDFIRTTEPRHKKIVQEILQDLYDRGEIYRAEYDGWYCTPCERFFTEKDLAEGTCPECCREVEQIKEANYFFRMGKYQDWLIEYIESHPNFIQPDFRRNETLGFLRRPLTDLCISRPKNRLNWGIDLPFDSDFVTYVWFDALVNYISAIGYRSDEESFKRWWPASYHLIGKDILTTHTVYWPTMLKAMGLDMPETIFAHGWWLIGESKMSKSLGNVVNPMDMARKYGVEPFRYFVMAEMSLGQDASFTEDAFVRRFNSDLANDLGNLLSRVLKMLKNSLDGVIPEMDAAAPHEEPEREVWQAVQQAVDDMEASVEGMKLDSGLASVMNAVRGVNRYLEQRKPWQQAREENKQPLARTLYTALESLRVCAGLLHPVMPEKMTVLRRALGVEAPMPVFADLRKFGMLAAGTQTESPGGLFPRVMPEKQQKPEPAPKKKAKQQAKPAEKKAVPAGVITYDEFMNVQLRTARILRAERVEGTEKLLKLQVEVGGERRQLVAGIARSYTPEALIGKTIVVVANLKPAKIRGIESNGMLLAANGKDSLRLITVDGAMDSGLPVR